MLMFWSVIWLLLQSPYLLFGLRVMGCGRKAWSFTLSPAFQTKSGLVLYCYKLMDFSLSILCFNPFPSLLSRDSSIFAGAIGFGCLTLFRQSCLSLVASMRSWCDTQHLVTGWCLFSASALCLERLCERVTPVFCFVCWKLFYETHFLVDSWRSNGSNSPWVLWTLKHYFVAFILENQLAACKSLVYFLSPKVYWLLFQFLLT